MPDRNDSLLRPFRSRGPWKTLIVATRILALFSLAYIVNYGILPEFMLDDGSGPKNGVVIAWIVLTIFLMMTLRRINDPMTARLPNAEEMISAAHEILNKYNSERIEILLARYERAGELGFRGGSGNMRYDSERMVILKVDKHARGEISEIRRLSSVRAQSKLRLKYYNVADLIDDRELMGRRVDRFLRSKGVGPEDVAPTRPLTSGE